MDQHLKTSICATPEEIHLQFVDDVLKILQSNNHYVYRTHLKVKNENGQRSSIDILLYKTIIICKKNLYGLLNHSDGYLRFANRIQALKKYYPDHQIFVIYDSSTQNLDDEHEFDISFDKFIHFDHISKLNMLVPHPKLCIEYCHPLFSFVSNLNIGSRYEHLYQYIYTTSKVIERCIMILNNKEETERFFELLKYINVVDNVPPECIELKTCNIDDVKTTYIMKLPNYSLVSIKMLEQPNPE